jgi:hypothetical protein
MNLVARWGELGVNGWIFAVSEDKGVTASLLLPNFELKLSRTTTQLLNDN